MANLPQIYLTQNDTDRLLKLIEGQPGKGFEKVYPASADIDAGRVSVLAPIGTALLGLRIGQSIDWALPGGEKQRYRIVGVPFQPEAAGEPG